MKLDENVRELIVICLWVIVILLMFFVLLIFIKETVSGTQIRMLIVATIMAIIAKYFMKEEK